MCGICLGTGRMGIILRFWRGVYIRLLGCLDYGEGHIGKVKWDYSMDDLDEIELSEEIKKELEL